MNLQTELIKEFAEVVHDVSGNKQRLSDNIVYGTLSKEGAHNYVKIDGSDLLTPVVVAASADPGDRVGVIIKNHTAIAGFNFSSPSVNTRTMENLVSAVNGKFDRIDATYITAEKANLTFATIQSLEAVDGKFDNLDTKFLTVENAKLQYATVEKLNATDAKVESISGDFANFKNGEFSTLKAKQASFESATTENFKATNAKVDNLESTSLKASEAEIKYATIESLNATNAKVKNLDATTLKAADAELTYATIESLNALKGDITDLNVGSLTARVATIEGAYISKTETKQLLAGYADIKLANVAAGTIGSALIGDGAITDAKIASVSANKLTAGTIDAAKITVINLNADNLTVGKINGKLIGTGTVDLDKLSKEVPTKAYLDSVQNGLQNQIDNAIQTYTTDTIPTLKNSPASSWTDNSIREKHVGDICYVTNAGGDADGYCYRFTNTGTSATPVYEWVLIKDSDVNKALQELVTVNGDISGLKTFQSETSSWRTSTDTEISSVKTRTTTIETTYSTKEETKSAADSAKSSAIESAKGYTDSAKTSAIESAKGYTDTAKTDAIASAKGYTDTATKDMATSTAVANAKKEAIDAAAKDASSKASTAQSTAISEAAKDATSKADAAKSSAISAAATDATTKANTAKSEAISTAASDATKKANDAKSAAIAAASSDATSKANTAKSEAISVAASDATNKANAALNSAKGYADDAVDNIAVGGRNLVRGTSSEWSDWIRPGTGINQCHYFTRITIPGDAQVGDSFTTTIELEWCDFASQSGHTFSMCSQGSQDGGWSHKNPFANSLFTVKTSSGKQFFQVTNKWDGSATDYNLEARVDYSDGNGKYRYRFIKAERGNKPTDWTPAPEDIDAAINTKVSTTVFNEVKQTVDANSATITRLSETVTTKADGSSVTTLSNTVNSIKQTADSNTAAISGLQTTVSKKADSSTVDTISKTLNTVKQTADSNSANISELSRTVSTKADGSTVTALTTRMSNAEQNLDGFKTTVSKTYVTSQTYNEKVGSLESGISAAQGTANAAKSTADAATTTANAAKSTADTASKTASAAKSTAEGAVSTANTAKNTADGAKSTADSAVNTANTAKSTADGAVSTANTAKSTADAANNTINRGLNKWLIRQFASSDASDTTIDKIVGKDIVGTYEYADSDLNISQMGLILVHNYNGYAVTAVKFSKTTSIETRFPSDDGGTVYLNGAQVAHNAAYSKDGVSCTLSFKKGWNVLEVVWYQGAGGNGFKFATTISKHANCERMDCYASVDTVETAYTKATTKKVISMSAEVTKTAEGLTSTANKVTTLTNDLAGVTTRLGTAESKISQNAESISAKVSTTDFNTFKSSNTTAINDAKSSAISTAASDATKKANDAKSSAISTAASDATTKANNAKSAAISTAASDATTKANNALNSAKTYSDGQIETVNAAITQTNSEISAMKGQIALKVEQTDINKAIDGVTERLSSLESWKSEASLKITKDGIIGTVGSYYATGADVTALTGRVTQAESTIKQQSDSIELTVKKDSVISAINQTSESVKISANKISLTAAGLVEIINSGDTKIKAANLNLSATDVVNIINSGTTKISADKLNLSGYVTISSLSGSGTTTIDGSNIKTGKISTDRLDVAAIFAKEVSATNLHVTGNSKIDGNLVTSGINASNITTGTISADRLDVAGIFAKDVTATGTITGATLVGSSITTKSGNKGSVDIAGDTISAKYSYASGKTQEMYIYADGLSFGETVKNGNSASTYSYVSLDQNGLYIQDIVHLSRSDAQATFSCGVVATGLGIHGSADISNDLRVYGAATIDRGLTVKNAGLELYAAKPFIDFHFGDSSADYTSRIIELESGKLNVNGVVCDRGGIWGTNIAIDGPGTFTRGITSNAESIFHTGSYTDPYPGKVCTIKSWGTVASLRFAAKGVSNTWLGAAKPDGAAYDTICTDANALVPGWRVRTADGAWVGASYAQDPGFRIYYCNASRLGGSNNGTDAIYTFGASGTFHAKSVSQTSDEREKNILSGITEKYEKLFMQLKPVLFNWKTGADGIHMGFGAQTTLDLAEKCGIRANELAAVHRSETEEPWSMSYTEIVPLTVQMTQKVTKKTVEQDQKIKILESHIQMLQTALDQAFVEIAKLKKAVG